MSFINWGSERPEQLEIRRRLEEQAMFEQAARISQARRGSSQPGVGGGGTPACTLAPIYWPTDINNFDSHTIDFDTPVTNVSRLTSAFGLNPNGHVHDGEFSNVNIYIDLWDLDAETWVNVWGRGIQTQSGSDIEYHIEGNVDANFVTIGAVSKLKVWSSPEMDQTFHDWGDNTTDKFILHSECPTACSPVRFLRDTVNWADQGGDENFDEYVIEFSPISNVTQLVSAFPNRQEVDNSGSAHTHSSITTSKLSIDLWDAVNSIWINVWNHQLENTFYSIGEDSYDYVIGGSVSVCFSNIESVTKMKVYVDSPSDQTYHDWLGEDSFKFYGDFS
jgi:hypothetical protein